LGRSILCAPRGEFEQNGATLGEGYGCFLEGLQDLGGGNLESAGQWWARAQLLPGRQGAALIVASHLALAAHAEGDVSRAVLLGEQALWAAENYGDNRSEMVACIGFALYHASSGRIRLVDVHVHQGERGEAVQPFARDRERS
jgi:hypothetical protein